MVFYGTLDKGLCAQPGHIHSDTVMKFADDTTVVSLVSDNDERGHTNT